MKHTYSVLGLLCFSLLLFASQTFAAPTNFLTPPANDDACSAIQLELDSTCGGTFPFSNVDATLQTNEPNPCFGGNTVWFKFTAPASGAVKINSAGGAYYGVAYVLYQVTDCMDFDSFTYQNCWWYAPSVTTYLTPGAEYYLQVWDYDNQQVSFCLEVEAIPTPPNDNVCDAIELGVDSVCSGYQYSNYAATGQPGEPLDCYGVPQTVWFEFVAPATGAVRIFTSGVSLSTAVFAASDCADFGTFTQVACVPYYYGQPHVAGGLTPGETYYVQLQPTCIGCGGDFCIELQTAMPPPNDNVCSATAVQVDSLCTGSYSTVDASIQPGEPFGCTFATQTTWFKFDAPASGAVHIRTPGAYLFKALYQVDSCDGFASFDLLKCAPYYEDDIYFGGLTAGEAYYVQVLGYNTGYCFEVLGLTPPANDNACDAFSVALDSACTSTYTLQNSTLQTGEPVGCGYMPRTVWFKFEAPATGVVEVVPSGNGYAQTSVFAADSCGAFTSILGCNGYDGPVFVGGLVPGNEYYVQVGGWLGYPDEFCLRINTLTPPPNDSVCNAIEIAVDSVCTGAVYTNLNATRQFNEPAPCGYEPHTVWFKFTAPATGAVHVRPAPLGNPLLTTLYKADSCGGDFYSFQYLDCTYWGIPFFEQNLTPGDTYYLQVAAHNGQPGDFCLEVVAADTITNDKPCDALELTLGDSCAPGAIPYFTFGATYDANEPTDCGFGYPSVWFKFTAPPSGAVEFTGFAPLMPLRIGVWQADTCGDYSTFSLAACRAFDYALLSHRQIGGLTPGETYLVQLTSDGGEHYFCLAAKEIIPPANDNICDATELALNADCNGFPYSNTGATTQPNETNPCFFSENTVWFKFTAPANGAVRVSTQAPAINTFAELYAADSCTDFNTVYYLNCEGYNYYFEHTNLTPGATYYLRSGGVSNEQGDFCIQVDSLLQWFYDYDGDGFGDPSQFVFALTQPYYYVANDDDCAPYDYYINPAATEICNGYDDNCNGIVDDGTGATYWADTDLDGFGDPNNDTLACSLPTGYVENSDDCNDADNTIYPGAPELCDTQDNDCDGQVDENFPTWYADADLDGFGNPDVFTDTICDPGPGFVLNGLDCNDANAVIFPNAPELCDTLDNDCDGVIDEGAQTAFYEDMDGDGYGNPNTEIFTCTAPSGFVTDNTDCNDNDPAINPDRVGAKIGNPFVINSLPYTTNGDNFYFGCWGSEIGSSSPDVFYRYTTGPCQTDLTVSLCSGTNYDSYLYLLDSAGTLILSNDDYCGLRSFFSYTLDSNSTYYIVVDGYSGNQGNYGMTVTGVVSGFYADADGDGFGDPATPAQTCPPPTGYVQNDQDCNDGDASINPDATETCNGLDDDCNGQVDEGASGSNVFYADTDGDGYGDVTVDSMSCIAPPGFVADSTDCDDSNYYINPGTTEVCNELDDDCDGLVDEDVLLLFFADTDGDGYGDAANDTLACSVPSGFVADSTDCNDGDVNINPGQAEICDNAIDDDCDGQTDEDTTPPTITCAIGSGGCLPTARAAYLTTIGGQPWGSGSNIAAMDAVFGASGWDQFHYETVNPATLLTPDYKVIFLEGSDNSANELNTFLSGNLPALEAWVNNGGQLFLNAGPNEGGNINFGFGGTTLNYAFYSPDGIMAAPAHPIFNGPNTPATGTFYGNSFAHAYVTATGATTLIQSSDVSNPLLVEKNWGAGKVMFGGMTTTNYHSPAPNADNMRRNILAYLDASCNGGFVLAADAGLCTATVNADSLNASFTDNCGAGGTLTHNFAGAPSDTTLNGATFPAGQTVVIWTATDASGNTATCVTLVSVTENEEPVVTCPADMTVTADLGACNATVNFTVTATDNCTADPTIFTSPLSGSVFNFGSTPVTAIATDASGNADTCTFYITLNPATEICNELDDDCDGQVDEDVSGNNLFFADTDGDGYGDPAADTLACIAPPGFVADSADCDDSNPSIYPGAAEICNGLDDDCDGAPTENETDNDNDTYLACAGDCDDNNPAVNPAAPEICDNLDNDCDGAVDENGTNVFYQDWDHDGYGNPNVTVLACTAYPGISADNTDCNDTLSFVNPAAPEICDLVDNDCDGSVDEDVQLIFYADSDGDGYGDAGVTALSCTEPSGFVADSTDCDDANVSIYPGAPELCNGLDDDCDGTIDDGLYLTYYADADGDGYGDPAVDSVACAQPANFVLNGGDCDDTNADIHPGASELCNGMDDDCDGAIDEGILLTYYADADGDSYGDAGVSTLSCTPVSGYVLAAGDCNDADAAVNPGATEVCNTIDDDCDGGVDEGVLLAFYADADGDTYGNPYAPVFACTQPLNYVANDDDCNDSNAAINPAATEICNGVDDDCDGLTDENAPNVFYADVDLDGFGDPDSIVMACFTYLGISASDDDCDDTNATIYPGATELCDGLDNDCDGTVDDDTFGPTVNISPSSTTVCAGASETLTASGGGTYLWSTGETTASITVAPTTTTTYTVTVTNAQLCTSTNTATVLVNNAAPHFDYVGVAPFDGHVVDPVEGGPYTLYTFRVKYTDADGDAPDAGYPRLILRYNPSGTSGNDLNLLMNPLPGGDFMTGKTYEVTWTGLPVGTNWNAHFIAYDTQGCLGESDNDIMPAPNEPDVFDSLDIYVFANDISFSDYSPDTSQVVSVFTKIHNDTDFPANNFLVRLHNDFTGEDIGTQTTSLAPHSTVTLAWTFTTPNEPSWNPIHVYIDDANELVETYENNNDASRPVVVGDYPLPGEIVASALAFDLPLNYNLCTSLSGTAIYDGLPPQLMLNNTGVAGAEVIFWLVGGTDTLTTTTNSNGQFFYPNAFCSPPLGVGTYTINGIVTDFTLVDTFSTTFSVYEPPSCDYPDLTSYISGPTNCILPGETVSYTVRVTNNGTGAAGASTLKITPSSNLSPNAAVLVAVPALAGGGGFFETSVTYTVPTGTEYVSISAVADFFDAVPLECSNYNNSWTTAFYVQPDLPNLGVYNFGYPYTGAICANNAFSVGLYNGSCVPADTSSLVTIVTETATGLTWTDVRPIPAFAAGGFNGATFPDLWPSVFPNTGQYRVDMYVDAFGSVTETDENNQFTTYINIVNCEIDLVPDCEQTRYNYVLGLNGTEGTFNFPVRVHNYGLLAVTDDFQVKVDIMDGATAVATATYTETSNIAAGSYADHLVTMSNTIPCAAGKEYRLRITVDALGEVAESSEGNNECDSPRLFKDYKPSDACYGYDFWDLTHPRGVAVSVYSSVMKRGDFKDNSLKVKFEVRPSGGGAWSNVGTAVIGPLQTWGRDDCPQYLATAPFPYAFPTPGTWEIRVTTDPLDEICESQEGNNVIIRSFQVTEDPDLVTYSQFINPDSLNPQPGQVISVDVTYKNIGQNIPAGDNFNIKLKLDNTVVGVKPHPLPGLLNGDMVTITFDSVVVPNTYIPGGPAELHIFRAIVDDGDNIDESDELNNEATRSFIIGLAPDDSIPNLAYAGGLITATVGNYGSGVEASAVLKLFYVDVLGQEFEIAGAQNIAVGALGSGETATFNFAWVAPSDAVQIIARVSNVAPQEYNELNNERVLGLQTTLIEVTVADGVSCENGTNGEVEVTDITGGDAPYSYAWSTGDTTALAENLAPGVYTVTVTDANGQTGTAVATVSGFPAPTVTITGDLDICNGQTTTLTGQGALYSPIWNTGATSASIDVSMAGTYTVTLTDEFGCTGSASATVIVGGGASASISGNLTVCGGATTTLTASGGDTFAWNTGATTAAITVGAGTYTVTATDAAGCTGSATATVTTVGGNVNAYITRNNNVSCHGGANGKATASATGSSAPYSYLWSNGATTAVNDGLTAGTYTVTVTSATGCTNSASVTISQPSALILVMTKTDVSCHNGSDGKAKVTASGGTTPRSILWSNGGTTAQIIGLVAGTYTATVTDANGCTASGSVEVVNPPAVAIACVSVVVQPNGRYTATVSGSGGTGALKYRRCIGGACTGFNSNNVFTGLLAGAYTFEVRDAKGCTASIAVNVPADVFYADADGDGYGDPAHSTTTCNGQPAGYVTNNGDCDDTDAAINPDATEVCDNIDNDCDGAVDDGVQLTFYADTDGDYYGDANSFALACAAPAGYVSNFADCDDTDAAINPDALEICDGADNNCNGQVDEGSGNGTGTTFYADADGDTFGDANSFAIACSAPAGYVSNFADCDDTDAGVNPAATEICNDGIDQNCNNSDGITSATFTLTASCSNPAGNSIAIAATGGLAPLQYSADGGATFQTGGTFSGLAAGTYNLVVADADGCQQTDVITVAPILGNAASHTNITCAGLTDGTASANPTGGYAPFSYVWKRNATTVGTTATITGLTAGNYKVTITDANGCTSTASVTVSAPTAISATRTKTNVTCFGANDGSIAVNVSGGTAPYTYLWNDGPTTEDRTGLAPGTYTMTVTDANGCQRVLAPTVISEPSALTVNVLRTNVSCFANADGTAKATANGGTGTKTYLWSTGETSSEITGLAPGTYTVTATDANGCTVVGTATIAEPAAPLSLDSVSAVVLPNGKYAVTVHASGGTTPYRYRRTPGNTGFALSNVFNNVVAGSYLFEVRDANGCMASLTANIPLTLRPADAGDRSTAPALGQPALFPNPAQDLLTVTLPAHIRAARQVTFTVQDMSGKTVQRTALAGSELETTLQIPLEGFAEGLYLLSIAPEGQAPTTLKFQKVGK
ncbi:MAG: MopE-related protein [Saprospiraceae bacterium]